jgi:RHS repeat-associated protein
MLQSAVVRKRAGPGFGCIGSANQVEDLYNGLGQLITEYQSHNGVVNTSTTPSVQYAYSFVTTSGGPNHSRLVSMTYPNGRVLNYNYNSGVDDRISRVSSISDSTGTLEAFSYLGLNTVVTRSHPQSGINQTYVIPGGNPDGGDQYTSLDRFGRVVEEKWVNPNTNTVTDDFLYTYDRDGNRLTSSNALDSALSQQFTYDNLNQLGTFTQGSHTESWSLDAVGNWLSFTDNGSTQTRSFNNQNQLTSISGATTPTYDANGNTLTDDNRTRYSYDAWNRIVQVVAGSQIENFSYDALGRRDTIQNNSNFPLDEYFSSNWQVIEEDQQGAVQQQFVWSRVYVDALVEQDAGSSRWYAQQDANWNVTAMLTSNGSVADRFVYDPYGKGTVYDTNWNLQGALSTTWVYYFQGGRYDAITGLYNFQHRDLSPTLGRWMQEDPAGYQGGPADLYLQETGNPIKSLDPSGRLWEPGENSFNCAMALHQSFVDYNNDWSQASLLSYCQKNWGKNAAKASCCTELQQLFGIANTTKITDKIDNCVKWTEAVLRNFYPRCIKVSPAAWEYPIGIPFTNWWLGHCAIKVRLPDDTVFYLDNGWWGNSGHIFSPNKVPFYVTPWLR